MCCNGEQMCVWVCVCVGVGVGVCGCVCVSYLPACLGCPFLWYSAA